jgi:hypothetical protein
MEPKFLRLLLAAILTFSLLLACAGQAPAPPPPEVLSLQEIIDLSRQGVPPARIVERIEASEAVYVLSVADVGRLQAAGVKSEVIDSLLSSCLQACRRPKAARRSLWYRQGQFYSPPPFSAYQGAYRFGD